MNRDQEWKLYLKQHLVQIMKETTEFLALPLPLLGQVIHTTLVTTLLDLPMEVIILTSGQ